MEKESIRGKELRFKREVQRGERKGREEVTFSGALNKAIESDFGLLLLARDPEKARLRLKGMIEDQRLQLTIESLPEGKLLLLKQRKKIVDINKLFQLFPRNDTRSPLR